MCGAIASRPAKAILARSITGKKKRAPIFADANGDGEIPAFVEIEPGWFRHQTPRRFACEREAGLLDKILSFAALLSRI